MDTTKAARAYVKVRDARAELKRAYEEADAELKAKLTRIESGMLKFCNEHGIDSVKTEAGTFYRQEDLIPTVNDWDSTYAFIMHENLVPEALERRLKKSFVKEFMEANGGALPPGVSVFRKYEIRVRR